MKKVSEIFDSLFEIIPGYIFGLLSFLVGLLADILALALSPEYVMWEKSISVLGHQTGGIYLRLGLIISGFLAVPFMVYFGRIIKDENVDEYLRRGAYIVGIFSSLFMSFAGIFSGGKLSDIHGFFALFSWLGGATFCMLFSLSMRKNSKFSKLQVKIGFIVAGIFIFYLIPFFITNTCTYFADLCKDFGDAVYTILPTTEWVLLFSMLFWTLFNSSYLLYKKI
ncbi:MAG: hypothetical protein ACFE8L_04595 [Candidatus Hodarchaeota archaeon]